MARYDLHHKRRKPSVIRDLISGAALMLAVCLLLWAITL